MRAFLKKKIMQILRLVSFWILQKYTPDVIGITGSVGKTTTKEAIYTILASTYNVRRNIRNYNNEVGVPLTIIGKDNPGRSLLGWIEVFLRAFFLIIFKDKKYPEILIIEMAADHPGDLKYLLGFVKPKIGVVTSVAPTHLEFFESIEGVELEKSQLILSLPHDGKAVLNRDDTRVYKMKEITKAQVLTFGFLEDADFVAKNVMYLEKHKGYGIECDVLSSSETAHIELKDVIANHILYSILAAFAVGEAYDLTLYEMSESLKDFSTPCGRMKIIKGIKNSFIIDDTYNSSPLAVRSALKTLAQFPYNTKTSTKIAVLGDMLELGLLSETAHQEMGEAVVEYKIDILVTVGELARDIARGAKEKGMSEDKILIFSNNTEAAHFLQNKINSGDALLIKGSQGMRMEMIVKELMAEPQKVKELLVRQK